MTTCIVSPGHNEAAITFYDAYTGRHADGGHRLPGPSVCDGLACVPRKPLTG